MKNYYPTQLIRRPSHARLAHTDIRCGDAVTLHPATGESPITSIVKVVVPLFGCTTYTSETILGADREPSRDTTLRFRFRLQDVHHSEPARSC